MTRKSRYILMRATPFMRASYKIVFDSLLAFIAFGIATALQQGIFPVDLASLWAEMTFFSLVAALVFTSFRTHRAIWRYTSITDLGKIGWAVLTLCMLYFGVRELSYQSVTLQHLPYSQPIITGLVLLAMISGQRVAYRLIHETASREHRREQNTCISKVLLIGAGDEAELFIRAVRQNQQSPYHVVGILDHRKDRKNRTIHGVRVLGRPKDLAKIVNKLKAQGDQPQRIVFTESVSGQADTAEIPLDLMMDRADELGLQFARLPCLTEFNEGIEKCLTEQPLTPIAIEDLLGRAQTKIQTETIRDFIAGKRVLITGAGGTIGGELSRQIAGFNPAHLTLLDNSEFNLYSIDMDIRTDFPTQPVRSVLCNIRNKRLVNDLFDKLQPEIVFHAAALKHVPLVEMNPCEGVLTNVAGTRNVADAAMACKARAFVQISTDKAVNPTNVMGASKRIGEYYAQALDLEGRAKNLETRFITVRFGNVLGSSGSVVPLFRKQLERGGPLTVTHPDIKRFFMTVNEATGLVLQASALSVMEQDEQRGRILVLDMGEPIRIADVARQMIRLAGRAPDEDIKVIYTGLRPGEKLYEELFDTNETPIDAKMPSAMAAIPQPIALEILQKSIAQLEGLAADADEERLIRQIGAIVPGFVHDGHNDLKDNLTDWQKTSPYT